MKLKFAIAITATVAGFSSICVPSVFADEYSVALAKYNEGKFSEALSLS